MLDKKELFEQMKQVADLAPCGVGVYDLRTNLPVILNKAYYKLIGYSAEEHAAFAVDFSPLLLPEDEKIAREGGSAFLTDGETRSLEYRIVRKDGTIRWVKLSISQIAVEGDMYAFATFTDITAEKDASAKLALMAENVGTSLSLIRISKAGEELIYGNEEFYKNVGITPEQYRANMPLIDRALVSEEDHERILQATREALTSGKPGEITHRYYRPDGKILWLTRRFAAIRQDEADTYMLVSAVTNVTEMKEKELELAIEKQRFQTVIEELNAAVFEWNLQTGSFYFSDAYQKYAISNVSQEDILNNRGSLDTVHPDDVPILRQFFAESTAGKERIEATLRLKTTEGEFRWCRMLGFFYKDKDGAPARTVGVIIDINEERERNVVLNSLINELPGGVAILYYDGEMKCPYYNDRFSAFNGRTREETDKILSDGTFVREVVAPVDYQRVLKTVDRCVRAGEPLDFTFRFIHKVNGVQWVHISGSKIREENGFPVYYCIFTIPSEEAKLYRDVVEDSPVGVIVLDRAKNNILYLNNIARAMYGFTNADIAQSHPVLELMKEHGTSPLLTEADVASLREDQYAEFHGMRGGKYLSLRARTLTWNSVDAYILYITDETKEHEEQVKLQKLIDGVPTGIGIYDADGEKLCLTYINEAYYRELGTSRETRQKYLGENSLAAVHPNDRARVLEMAERLVHGENLGSVLLRLVNGSGEWVWHKMTGSVVERNGKHVRVYAAFTNCNDMMLAQQKLEENQRRESVLLSSIPGGVAVYRMKKDGRVATDYISAGLAKMCGYGREEFEEQLRDNAMINVCEADMPIVMEAAAQSIAEGTPISVTYRIHTRSEGDILTRLDASPMDENELGADDLAVWYAVHTRVSKSAALAMREQAHYRSVLDMLGIAYWEWSKENGFYTSENYAQYALSQRPLDDVSERKVVDHVVHPDDLEMLKSYLSGDGAQTTPTITLRMLMTDGSYQWTELISFTDYSESGELIRRSGTLRNVNDEWIRQRRILEQALEEAQSANKAKTAFLSRISHDMRTPLNGIMGLAGLIREKIDDPKALSDLVQLEVSGQYLMNLINDTLDVGRIESGKLELHPSVCDGRAIFDSVTALAMPAVAAKNIHIQIKTNGLAYPMLYIDIGRVQQIMLNVLGNATKFTPQDGHISCTMTRLSESNGVITDEVCVADDGIGISPAFLPHIFEPFSQEDGSKKNTHQGTGLGLMIARQLVEMMGGSISVSSQQGGGTRVTYTLVMPVATEEQIAQWRKTQNTTTDDTILAGKHVLLCEDHPINAKITIRLLEKKGMTVILAENGRRGLDLFTALPEGYFDAILMDIRMPEMDGLEATAAIRGLNRPDAAAIPIIAVTANALDEDVRQTKEAGMNEHLSKPIQPEILYQVLSRYFAGGQKNPES